MAERVASSESSDTEEVLVEPAATQVEVGTSMVCHSAMSRVL
jgi:hypothetical protein